MEELFLHSVNVCSFLYLGNVSLETHAHNQKAYMYTILKLGIF